MCDKWISVLVDFRAINYFIKRLSFLGLNICCVLILLQWQVIRGNVTLNVTDINFWPQLCETFKLFRILISADSKLTAIVLVQANKHFVGERRSISD